MYRIQINQEDGTNKACMEIMAEKVTFFSNKAE